MREERCHQFHYDTGIDKVSYFPLTLSDLVLQTKRDWENNVMASKCHER